MLTTPSPERRWQRLAVTAELLVDMAKITEWTTIRVNHNPLPSDARCVAVWPSVAEGVLYLVLESASYAPVEEGRPIPVIYRPPSFARWFGPGLPEEVVVSEEAKT